MQYPLKLLWRTRNAHIQYYLEVVAEQQSYNEDDQYTDYIDNHITKEIEAENKKICEECGSVSNKSYRFCRVCVEPVNKVPAPNIGEKSEEPSQVCRRHTPPNLPKGSLLATN